MTANNTAMDKFSAAAFPQKMVVGIGSIDPATGLPATYGQVHIQTGMSLRDYFAAQAMAHASWYTKNPAASAEMCYRAADAMLAERAK